MSAGAEDAPRGAATGPLRVAYLVNQYPLLSHSFIRREIRALEEQGTAVLRLSIRPPAAALENASDREELERTRIVLRAGAGALAAAALRALLQRPLCALHALAGARRRGAALGARARAPPGLLRRGLPGS